ncbi:MAG: DNA internalization-related competence protein ComEC/Rec2 [Limnohabitans sp.]
MLAVASLLQWRACRWPVWERWYLAATAVCAWDPWALLQPGFWLSFVAVGILFLMPQQANPSLVAQTLALSRWQKIFNPLKQLWREQWWLTLALTPLTLWFFHQVSIIGLGVNMLAIPWVTLLVTPLAFAGVLWSPLWQVCGFALQALMSVLEPLSSLSWAVWRSAAPPWWLGIGGLFGSLMWVRISHPTARIVPVVGWLAILFWPTPRPAHGVVQVLFADIGQGNAVLVRTAQHSLMFDTGPRFGVDNDAGQRVLLPVLQHMNERIDALVLSHQDSDHTGGALSLMAQNPQAQVWSSITRAHWLSQQLEMQRCIAGQAWKWDGVTFEFIHPLESDYERHFRPNARSCVLRIQAQGQTVLLTADIEALQEQALLQRMGDALRADVILVPHHGSKTSSTESFIDAVRPRWALFQHGYLNRYGHPAPVVVQRYADRGVRILHSPTCGAMHWRSDIPQAVLCQRDLDKRYWRF